MLMLIISQFHKNAFALNKVIVWKTWSGLIYFFHISRNTADFLTFFYSLKEIFPLEKTEDIINRIILCIVFLT